jgi:hypothetical protein
MDVTVPVSNAQRIACAAKRSGASPTKLRAGLIRETFSPQIHRPLWNALIEAAGVEVPDDATARAVISGFLRLVADEIEEATPEMVAQILSVQRDLLEGVDQCR